MRISRDDRSIFANWWFTVDKVLLVAILVLIGTGVVLSLAASPPVAVKRGLDAYYYVERHAVFAIVATAVMLFVSLLSPLGVRRIALAGSLLLLVALVVVLFVGKEVKGASRWLEIAGHSLQPSEFFKPVFVVSIAWAFELARERGDRIALFFAVALFVASAGLLVLEPDVGQTVLIAILWGALFLLSGFPIRWAVAFGLSGLAAFVVAYLSFAHVRARIGRFLDPASGDSYQMDRALQSFTEGGFLGRGPGEGTIKHVLPDAHTDFIFAVVAEEYGILACLVLLGLFAFIVFRALARIWNEPNAFIRNATMGLILLFALQASINMAVNVGLLPAKGMTLPFISAGGSSMLSLGVLMGMVLSLTRWRPDRLSVKKPTLSYNPLLGTPFTGTPGGQPAEDTGGLRATGAKADTQITGAEMPSDAKA